MAINALRPLAPGVQLMRRLRVPVKLALIGLALLVPMTVLVVSRFVDTRTQIVDSSRELVGARQISLLVDLVASLQAHRDAALRGAADRATLQADLQGRLAAISGATEPLLTADATTWKTLQQQVQDIAAGRGPTQRNELFAQHVQAVEVAMRQMQLTAEASGLLLDPEAATYYLMDLSVARLAPWLEALSRARGQGAVVLARGEITSIERTALMNQADRIERELGEVQLRLDSLSRIDIAPPAVWAPAAEAARRLSVEIRKAFAGDALGTEQGPYFDLATKALDAGATMKHVLIEDLVARLEARVAAKQQSLIWHLGLSTLGVLLLAYFALAFYASFAGAVRSLHRGVEKVAAGDLSHTIHIEGRDELAEIGQMVERMNARLSALVAEIRSSAVRVSLSGETVASGSRSLAERTEQQAASLRETVATVHNLSTAVAANAEEAGRLDELTARLRDQAEAGGTEMHGSIEAMAALEDSSRRVGEIIGVIDSIAFQTNILALNAAVEAARAGEAGRGFAVVASEVRHLAQRSASAAAEIRSLIARSGEQVETSVRRTREVGSVLGGLVDGVRRVSQALQTIAQASASQSADLAQVTASVGNLDEITRRNAEMVGLSTQAAGELVGRAGALRESVSMIRLRQGSADEAKTLVDRAIAIVQQRGLQAAGEPLRSREEGFVDRDLYVFVVDRQGRYVLHGAKPAMEGKRVHDLPGIDGDRFVKDAFAAAGAGGGWIDYDIVNPETGKVQPKASYVVAVDDVQVLGCGIYRDVSIAA